jgi:hypothetical protein
MRLERTIAARAALIAAVPAWALAALTLPSVHVLADADSSTALLELATVLVFAAVAAAAGPSALGGRSRVAAVAIAFGAVGTMFIGGFVWLVVASLHLCSSSAAPGIAALCTAAAVYAPGSALAFRDPGRTAWAWPLVIVVALAASLGVLALATGGPHWCET